MCSASLEKFLLLLFLQSAANFRYRLNCKKFDSLLNRVATIKIFMQNALIFFLQVLTVVVIIALGILAVVGGIIALVTKAKLKPKEKIELINLNEKYKGMQHALNSELLTKQELKQIAKQEKEAAKLTKKQEKNNPATPRKRIFILNFCGDLRASQAEDLREEITALLTIATPKDEVLAKIESTGGVVHGYGFAASQLERIRAHNIPLTAAVDKVAASGGYMMACVADKIIAAPFAIIGSIGVIAQLPNFHRLLKKHDIDFEQIMAGEYKRTLTIFGENTNKDRKKMQEEVNEAHELFKNFVATHRPNINISRVATGEYWYGIRAQELRLVDEITTSDDYLLEAREKADLYTITYSIKKSLLKKFGLTLQKAADKFAQL